MNIYREIQDDHEQLGYPIAVMEHLPQTKSCIPQNHGQSKSMIQNISCAIYRRLTIIILSTNTVLIAMLEPYLKERNGYACLWSLMRRSCAYMKPEPEGWGPSWTSNMTPEQYVVQLQLHCCSTNRKNTKVYSRFHQSKEMLHQAAFSYNQPIATKLDIDLAIWKNANRNTDLPDEWQIEGLLDKFSDCHINIQQPSSEIGGATMSINALLQKPERERNFYNNNKKKFEIRPIQCDCCQCGGHQIGEQVCQIGAQVHHI